jgi:hypothetical protein
MYYKFPLNLFLPNWADLNEKQMMFWCCIKYFSYTVSYGDGSHFGFQINRLKINFSRVHPKIIHLELGSVMRKSATTASKWY